MASRRCGNFNAMTEDRLARLGESRKILIVAPHPDDETLGCGGLIATFARRGASFQVVFVTDGGASHPHSVSWPRQRLVARRQWEAREALRRLGAGAGPWAFLGLHDAAMPRARSPKWDEAVAHLATIAHEFQPDLALLPWRRDPHCDHRDSWTLAQAALVSSLIFPLTLEYAIWLDELGAPEDYPRADEAEPVTLDIAAVISAKRAAVEAYTTQTTSLINDDPAGFRLTASTIARLTRPSETFWWCRHAGD
jgi:LmbE family N-acetylglucosaminyl deacetylase